MKNSLFEIEQEVVLCGDKYKLEFDNKAFARAELLTGKGVFALAENLMEGNNLTLEQNIELFCCALMKHHSDREIEKVKELLTEKPILLTQNLVLLMSAFIRPIFVPDDGKRCKKKVAQKKK